MEEKVNRKEQIFHPFDSFLWVNFLILIFYFFKMQTSFNEDLLSNEEI